MRPSPHWRCLGPGEFQSNNTNWKYNTKTTWNPRKASKTTGGEIEKQGNSWKASPLCPRPMPWGQNRGGPFWDPFFFNKTSGSHNAHTYLGRELQSSSYFHGACSVFLLECLHSQLWWFDLWFLPRHACAEPCSRRCSWLYSQLHCTVSQIKNTWFDWD